MAVYFEYQSQEWKDEFYDNLKLQDLYGNGIPTDLWKKLLEKAKNRQGKPT